MINDTGYNIDTPWIISIDSETELAVKMEELLRLIDERKMQMVELWEKNREFNQKIYDISIEIDQLLNEYYRLTVSKPLRQKAV